MKCSALLVGAVALTLLNWAGPAKADTILYTYSGSPDPNVQGSTGFQFSFEMSTAALPAIRSLTIGGTTSPLGTIVEYPGTFSAGGDSFSTFTSVGAVYNTSTFAPAGGSLQFQSQNGFTGIQELALSTLTVGFGPGDANSGWSVLADPGPGSWTERDLSAAPAPATLTLLGIGAGGLAAFGWRKRKLAAVR